MKLKEISRTAIQSWSPANHHPIYLATGTSAKQLDASFSSNASLEIFQLDLADPSLDMKLCGTFPTSHRYHKLVWGPHGMQAEGLPSGVLIAGGENGDIILYDPAKIIAGQSDAIISQSDKHTGPVRALDVNPFQTNLIASGGNESEIYIWDMNNFGSPMTPGPKTQPLEDISCIGWNRQVAHILASASPGGRASVWDLRKNDLIIKVSDHSNRMHCSGLAWNPEVATQLVLASEDDRMPVIQMWDLRFATSPLKIFENHTRGVLSIAWSLADPELLLSCGKDSRILCWNPNTAEVIYELPASTQWCFDIQWCPRNPAVLSAAAFDGHIGVYSIMGGNNQAQNQRDADQISNSFGNMDPFGTGQTLPPLQLPQTSALPATAMPLKKPPKWLRRPVGASFAFGGKLVSLENVKAATPQQAAPPVVHVSQVVTETALLERSRALQTTLSAGDYQNFCQSKIDTAQNDFEKTVWSFLKVNFDNDVREKYLELLGYKKEELALKISAALEENTTQPVEALPVVELTAPPANLQLLEDSGLLPCVNDSPAAVFDLIAQANVKPEEAQLTDSPQTGSDLAEEEAVSTEPEPSAELLLPVEETDIPLEQEAIASIVEEPSSAEEPPAPVEEPAEISAPVEEPAEIPAPVEDPTVIPALLEEPPEVPVLEEERAEIPALVEGTAEVPALIQVPSLFEGSAAFPAPIEGSAAFPGLIEESAAFPAPIEGSAAFPGLIEGSAAFPAPIEGFAAFPGLIEGSAAFPPPIEGHAEFPAFVGGPAEVPFWTEDPTMVPVLTEEPAMIPFLTEEPATIPFLTEEPATIPFLTEEPATIPFLTEEPATIPFLTEEPAMIPFLTEEPATIPFLTEEPAMIPFLTEEPATIPFLTEEPAMIPDLVDGPVEVPALVDEPLPAMVPVLTEEPAMVPVLTKEPAMVPVLTEELAMIPVLTEEPAMIPVLTEEPAMIPDLVEGPVDVPALIEEPVEDPAPPPATTELTTPLRISQDVDGLITQALLTGDFAGAVDLCLHDNRMADSIILAIAGGTELLEKTQRKYFTKTTSKLNKLISAVVLKDWNDILQTCDLRSWKEALAAVMTYSHPDEFCTLCNVLGGRLETAADSQLQIQACLCYICAGNVEKLVSCWTKAQNGHCPLSLQELVEKVEVLRRAVEQTQGSCSSAMGVPLGDTMSRYASLLASQGSLTTAIAYLPENSDQVAVQQLRERLSRALGQQQQQAAVALAAPAAAAQPQSAQTQPPGPQAQPSTALPAAAAFHPGQPQAMVPQPPAAAPLPMAVPASTPVPPQYYQPVRSTSTVTSWSNQTPTALPSAPPPQVGTGPDPQAEPSSPVYGMPAPAGAAAPPPSSTAPQYMYSQQYHPYAQVGQLPPRDGGPHIYQPLQYPPSAQAVSSSAIPYSAPQPPGFLAQYSQAPYYPGPPPLPLSSSSAPPSHHPPVLPTSSAPSFPAPLSYASSGGSFQHGGPGSPPATYMPPPPPFGASGPQNGWNDPPALNRAAKKKGLQNYTPPTPITAPIMTPLGGEPQAVPVPSIPSQTMVQGPPGVQAPYSGLQQQQQQHHLPHPPMNPAMPPTSVEGAPGAPIGDVIQPMQSIPAEKITKKPIPEEHQVLKTTFEGLIHKCLAAATDPQTKRKLDDASKRLESLYDKLREQALSPAIVGGLHNMAKSIESRSYADCLNIHTHIVSSSNFSEISAFMPVLKVVLTQANRLGV